MHAVVGLYTLIAGIAVLVRPCSLSASADRSLRRLLSLRAGLLSEAGFLSRKPCLMPPGYHVIGAMSGSLISFPQRPFDR